MRYIDGMRDERDKDIREIQLLNQQIEALNKSKLTQAMAFREMK